MDYEQYLAYSKNVSVNYGVIVLSSLCWDNTVTPNAPKFTVLQQQIFISCLVTYA